MRFSPICFRINDFKAKRIVLTFSQSLFIKKKPHKWQSFASNSHVFHNHSAFARWPASTASRSSRRPPKRAWASTTPSTRWSAKFARTRSSAARRAAAARGWAHIVVLSATFCKRRSAIIAVVAAATVFAERPSDRANNTHQPYENNSRDATTDGVLLRTTQFSGNARARARALA